MDTEKRKYAKQERYEAKRVVKRSLKFNVRTDADIIIRMAQEDNFQGFVKRAIRELIEREEQEIGR